MSRRGENIYKRADGRWEARYRIGEELGKAKYGYVYAPTYNEVKKKRAQAMQLRRRPQERALTARVLAEWLAWKETDPSIHRSTIEQYRRHIEKHIVPWLGQIQVARLDARTLDRFRAEKLRSGRLDGMGGLSAAMVDTLMFVIFSALRYAQEENYISELPRRKTKYGAGRSKRDIRVFSKAEQAAIEEALCACLQSSSEQHGIYMGIFFALYTGLRVGELGGLQWRDIDFGGPEVTVRRTLQRIRATQQHQGRTVLELGPPKSETSLRQFPLRDDFARMLRDYYDGLPAERRGAPNPVFSYNGKPIEPRIFQQYFKKVLRQAGVEDAGFHALRHTFATRCIESNMDIQSLSECLGHSNSGITLGIYAHSFAEHKKQCLNRLTFMSQSPLLLSYREN